MAFDVRMISALPQMTHNLKGLSGSSPDQESVTHNGAILWEEVTSSHLPAPADGTARRFVDDRKVQSAGLRASLFYNNAVLPFFGWSDGIRTQQAQGQVRNVELSGATREACGGPSGFHRGVTASGTTT